MILENALGLAASTISFLLFVPQGVRTWQVRDNPVELNGVSLGTQFLILANATIWFLYAWLTQAFWVGAPGIVNLPLALATIYLVLRARRMDRISGPSRCVHGAELGAHRIFVTARAGFGSVMPCSAATAYSGVVVASQEDIDRARSGHALV